MLNRINTVLSIQTIVLFEKKKTEKVLKVGKIEIYTCTFYFVMKYDVFGYFYINSYDKHNHVKYVIRRLDTFTYIAMKTMLLKTRVTNLQSIFDTE